MDKIFDSVHGFIHFNPFEQELIDSFLFQRLHHIRQMGLAYFVYPGARHSRFEHSLGVMHLASKMFDKIAIHCPQGEEKFWKTLLRLASLCHDLGHLPFSHVAEKPLLGEKGHELWTCRMIEHPDFCSLWEKVGKELGQQKIKELLIKIAVGKEKLETLHEYKHLADFSPWEELVSNLITGDFLGADRIDYLIRDAKCSGVSYGAFDFHQLMESIAVGNNFVLGVEPSGIEACDALLLARHFMYKRIYRYPLIKAYNFHLCRFLEKLFNPELLTSSLENYLSLTESKILHAIDIAMKDQSHLAHADALAIFDQKYRYHCLVREEKPSLAGIYAELADQIKIEEIEERELAAFPVIAKNREVYPSSRFSNIEYKPRIKYFIYIPPKPHLLEELYCSL